MKRFFKDLWACFRPLPERELTMAEQLKLAYIERVKSRPEYSADDLKVYTAVQEAHKKGEFHVWCQINFEVATVLKEKIRKAGFTYTIEKSQADENGNVWVRVEWPKP